VFRRRLTLVLTVLAVAIIAQGVGAAAMHGVAERQVLRGRVASDIELGFFELAASKQRLRTWVAQVQQGAGADPAERDLLLAEKRDTLVRLQSLARDAASLGTASTGIESHVARQDALAVLLVSLDELAMALARVQPLTEGADARQAWEALSQVFDLSQGRDLRQLLTDSKLREADAVKREREAAGASLARMRTLGVGMAGTLALAALLAAVYFARALRRPLDELHRGALALQRGDLRHRIALGGADEFGALAGSVNAMAAELEQHRERESRQRHDLEALVHARTTELQRALEALQQGEARRRRLFADISHELRTPTTAIRGEAEITLRGRERPVEEYRGALQRIVQTTQQLARVIDDLLAMARNDLEALSLVRRRIALAQPLQQALAQARTLAAERGVALAELARPAQTLWVLADEQRLRQLLMVLLDNAIAYTPAGGRVEVSVELPGGDDAAVAVCVADTGIGIGVEELPQVFERHYRGAAARRQRAEGSGLGLPIARALAAAHGGTVTLDSEPGRGTRAMLRLPLLEAAA
jgi:two-component system, OmpR family, sensor kinase